MDRPAQFDLVVLAASAGGIEALQTILAALPRDFPTAIAVVQHRPPHSPNHLVRVLQRRTPLHVEFAQAGTVLRGGVVYLARPDAHLVVRPDRTFALRDGTKVRHVHSSAIPLLESAAQVLGGAVIAVVLTGGGSDATDGVQAVHASGGVVIAQDPRTAFLSGMPTAAIRSGVVDYVLPLDRIAPTLEDLVAGSVTPRH